MGGSSLRAVPRLAADQAHPLLALFSWDGSIEIEEDFPPYALVPELRSGTWVEEERDASYSVRWVEGERRSELWARYGIHESPGHYMAIAASRRPRN